MPKKVIEIRKQIPKSMWKRWGKVRGTQRDMRELVTLDTVAAIGSKGLQDSTVEFSKVTATFEADTIILAQTATIETKPKY